MTSGMGRFEGYGPPAAGASMLPSGAAAGRFGGTGGPGPAAGFPMAPGNVGQIASGFAAVDATAQRAEQLEGAIKDIREYCTDAGDIGSTYVYIEVIDEILKRHGLDS